MGLESLLETGSKWADKALKWGDRYAKAKKIYEAFKGPKEEKQNKAVSQEQNKKAEAKEQYEEKGKQFAKGIAADYVYGASGIGRQSFGRRSKNRFGKV